MPLVEAIGGTYFMWNIEQHILTLKYDILCSLVPPVKHYFLNMEEDDNQLKITRQHCNMFVTCKDRSGELLYITFLHSGLSLLDYILRSLIHKCSTFSGLLEKMQCMYQKILK